MTATHTLWNADQCARQRGVTVDQWNNAVYAGQEPLPSVTEGGIRLWNSFIVTSWRQHGLLEDDEWFAQQCADHHGITRKAWTKAVRDGTAPQPARHIGHRPVWKIREARKPLRNPPRPTTWGVQKAASHLGLTPYALLQYSQNGLCPAPVGKRRNQPFWSADEIRRHHSERLRQHREAKAAAHEQRLATAPRWTAKQCAKHHGITTPNWRAAVRDGAAPAPLTTTPHQTWDANEVQHHPTAQIHAWEEDQRSEHVRLFSRSPLWTAQDCADYHGIPLPVWRAAVRDGLAPRPLTWTQELSWQAQDVISLPCLG